MPTPAARSSHPPGCYYVNLVTGTIQRQCNPLLASTLAAAGFFGTDGPALATNAFPTFEAAHAFASSQSGSAFSGKVASAAQAPLAGINAVGDFFNRLTQPNTWIRVGEVLGGLLLVYLGLRASMSGTEAGDAFNKGIAQPVKKASTAVAGASPPGKAVRTEVAARRAVRGTERSVATRRRAREIRAKRAGTVIRP